MIVVSSIYGVIANNHHINERTQREREIVKL